MRVFTKFAPKTVVSYVFSVIILGSLAVAGLFFATGGKQFTVETPSMAQYAPVGTVVLSRPTDFTSIRAGDTILFKPPGSGETYFHRVVEVTPTGLQTKGDLNATVDPWTITPENMVGKELVHIQSLGFLIEALPLLILGGILLHILAHFFFDKYWRFPGKVLGWSFLVSVAAFFFRPFVKADLISQLVVDGTAETKFVPTGIFDINAVAVKGTQLVASPGELASVESSYHNKAGYYNVLLSPHIEWWGWIILGVIWSVPTVLILIYTIRARKLGNDLYVEESKSEELVSS